ncbi:DUF4271 domain-containing protein [Fulvivirga sp.]|uniref:DUF4271 domain-containing protein n=1 Tax=Fulvivirga sp. TaxID=1931237 RepID=UPI0032EC4C86
MRVFFYIIILIIFSGGAFAQTDTVLVKDFSNEWYFFDGNKQLPLVRKSDFKGNIVTLSIDKRDYEDALLSIQSSQEISLFVNGSLIDVFSDKIILDFQELGEEDDIVSLSIYSKTLNPYLLSTGAYRVINGNLDPLKDDVVVVNPRSSDAFFNFLISSLVVLGIFFAILMNRFPKVMSEYFRLSRAISPRELDENLLKSRPLVASNMFVYAFLSLVIAFNVLGLVNISGALPQMEIFHPSSFGQAILSWLQISVLVFGAIFLKLIVVGYFASLYSLQGFINSHFYNFTRLLLMIACFVLLLITFFQLGGFHLDAATYYNMYIAAIFSLTLLSVIIYLKLLSSAPFKNLHLFSYLCATELIPFVIILSLGINKSF